MGRIKRPGLKAPSNLRSGDASVGSGYSTRSGLSRGRSVRSAAMSKSGHGMSSSVGKSGRSTGSGDPNWGTTTSGTNDTDEEGGGGLINKSSRGLQRTGQSMRNFLKTAGSVGSGMGGGGSTHSGGRDKSFKLSHKQKKARPGLAVAPQGMSTRSGMSSSGRFSSRGMSTRSGISTGSAHASRSKRNLGSAHSSGGGDGTGSGHKPKKQMSMRSLSGHSARSLGSGGKHKSTGSGSGGRQKSARSIQQHSSSKRGGMASASAAPAPPEEDYYDDDDYEEFAEYDEEEELVDDEDDDIIELPQTEEEIRKGLHTEHVTKGIFRKKVRSIKWYSADIDKVDAGNFEAERNDSDDEYETDSDDDSAVVIPDPWYIALGRGLLLLEKKGEEVTALKRWVRCLTWTTFICEATGAIVSLVQFAGVQSCCGRPILNLGGINVNWPAVIRYATILYLVLIIIEIYPVLRRAFPFNIVNPLFGFLITFALFFDDSYVEALCMWVIETMAVLSEFSLYRVKIRQVNMRAIEIKKLMPKTTKKKESFEDEDDYLKDLHKARRRYYVLKQEQRMDQRLLQYLHVAVYMNIVMSSIVLMLILVIARNGGLCIVNWDYPNPFLSNQLARCDRCSNAAEGCQVCDDDLEVYQCYFPYS